MMTPTAQELLNDLVFVEKRILEQHSYRLHLWTEWLKGRLKDERYHELNESALLIENRFRQLRLKLKEKS